METQTKKENGNKAHYSIFRPVDQVEGDKKPWPRVGVAFKNRDGSLNLILNEAIAPNTRLQVRISQKGEGA